MSSLRQRGERAEFVFEAEAFQLEGSANVSPRQEDVIALGPQRPRGRFRQAGVGLQGFMKHLHLPPFFVGRGDGVIVARQVAAHQMQSTCASVFVCKDSGSTTRTSSL